MELAQTPAFRRCFAQDSEDRVLVTGKARQEQAPYLFPRLTLFNLGHDAFAIRLIMLERRPDATIPCSSSVRRWPWGWRCGRRWGRGRWRYDTAYKQQADYALNYERKSHHALLPAHYSAFQAGGYSS